LGDQISKRLGRVVFQQTVGFPASPQDFANPANGSIQVVVNVNKSVRPRLGLDLALRRPIETAVLIRHTTKQGRVCGGTMARQPEQVEDC